MSLKRVWIASPNYSSRGGAKIRLVVLHTAEGAKTYQSLGNFFANPSSGVSSHVGIDDTQGVVGQYVHRDHKAWTQGNANPVAVSAELCAFAEWDEAEWARHRVMLDNTARWVMEECMAFGIPIRALTSGEAQGGVPGVCQHVDLGGWGGGHWDCGPAFPMAQVIYTAALYAANGGPISAKEDDVFIRSSDKRVRWFIAGGDKSKWRLIGQGMEQDLEKAGVPIISDPNDSWLDYWDH